MECHVFHANSGWLSYLDLDQSDDAPGRNRHAGSTGLGNLQGTEMRANVVYFSLALLLYLNGAALAQDEDKKKTAADPHKGALLAERWCASCHIVSSTQGKGTDITPSFASIAQRADFSVEKLAFFLLDPHPIMPRMTLSRDEARDLAAYIANQRR